MTVFALVSLLAGIVLILMVQLDIVATVLHPEIESPISTRFQRISWRVLRALEYVVPERNGVYLVLNWGLPLMVAGLIALWLVLLTAGYALLVYPWIGDDRMFVSTTPRDPSFLTALYYSGVTLATLGYGDIQPISGPFRVLAVLEAISGAVTIAFGVAYVLAVYPALSRTRTLAAALDAEVAGQAGALPMVRRYLNGQEEWSADLAARLRELSLELLALTEMHETHPVLYYSHQRRVQHSFVRVLVTVQSLVGLLRYGLSPDAHPTVVRNPQLLLLEQSLHYSLRRLSTSLHIPPIPQPEERAERRRLAAGYRVLCDELEQIDLVPACAVATQPVPVLVDTDMTPTGDGTQPDSPVDGAGAVTYAGQPVVLDPALDLVSSSALEAYVIFRLETDPHIAAYAAACGYPIEAARADYETTWWIGGR